MKRVRILEGGDFVVPYHERNLRADFKHISFPAYLGDKVYPELGVHELHDGVQPPYDADTEKLTLSVETNEDEQYVEVWSVEAIRFDEAALRERQVMAVKQTASNIITARLPSVKQLNLLAFTGEYTQNIVLGITPTASDDQTMAYAKREWEWVKSVRVASNEIEALLASLPVKEANAYDIEKSDLWPQS